jgi:hypothetical protein
MIVVLVGLGKELIRQSIRRATGSVGAATRGFL